MLSDTMLTDNEIPARKHPLSIAHDWRDFGIDCIFAEKIEPSYPAYDLEVHGVTPNTRDIILRLAIPGYQESELEVYVIGLILHIVGKRSENVKQSPKIYSGIHVKSFVRRFRLGEGVEINKAVFQNGILTIIMNDHGKMQIRKMIPINGKAQKSVWPEKQLLVEKELTKDLPGVLIPSVFSIQEDHETPHVNEQTRRIYHVDVGDMPTEKVKEFFDVVNTEYVNDINSDDTPEYEPYKR